MNFLSARAFTPVLAAIGLLAAAARGAPSITQVQYQPASITIQGNQALTATFVLSVTSPNSPGNFTTPVATTVVFSVLSAPTGVSNAQALAFVSASPSILTFTSANQTLTTTITVAVPLGNFAGNYGFQINTPGWPSGLVDGRAGTGATLSANISPPLSNAPPPTVTLLSPADGTTYTYDVTKASSVAIPISFTANVSPGTAPLTHLLATVSGPTGPATAVPGLITSGIGLLTGSGTASFAATAPGAYTIMVEADNSGGTAQALSTVNVTVTAPPPTIVATNPTLTTYNYTLGGPAISVPVGCSATTLAGTITTLTASMVGPTGANVPVTLATTGLKTALTATGTGTVSVSAPGTYTITYTATSAYGSASTSVTFTVNGIYPVPTIAITAPARGAAFQIPAGGKSVPVPYSLVGGTTYGTITSVVLSLTGPSGTITTTNPPSVTGIGTPSISGSGNLTITAPGTYTISVTDSNGKATASASTTFTVTQAQAQPTEVVTWLPPVANGQSICGGSVMPVSFTVTTGANFVSDTSIVVAIYQVYTNGTSSTPVIYSYNSKGCSWSGCNGGSQWGWWGGFVQRQLLEQLLRLRQLGLAGLERVHDLLRDRPGRQGLPAVLPHRHRREHLRGPSLQAALLQSAESAALGHDAIHDPEGRHLLRQQWQSMPGPGRQPGQLQRERQVLGQLRRQQE